MFLLTLKKKEKKEKKVRSTKHPAFMKGSGKGYNPRGCYTVTDFTARPVTGHTSHSFLLTFITPKEEILTRLMFFAETGAGRKGTTQFAEVKVATVCFMLNTIGRNRITRI